MNRWIVCYPRTPVPILLAYRMLFKVFCCLCWTSGIFMILPNWGPNRRSVRIKIIQVFDSTILLVVPGLKFTVLSNIVLRHTLGFFYTFQWFLFSSTLHAGCIQPEMTESPKCRGCDIMKYVVSTKKRIVSISTTSEYYTFKFFFSYSHDNRFILRNNASIIIPQKNYTPSKFYGTFPWRMAGNAEIVFWTIVNILFWTVYWYMWDFRIQYM